MLSPLRTPVIDRPKSLSGAVVHLAPDVPPVITSADRTLSFVFSNGGIDRYGDRIDPAGWDLKNYSANPIVLFGHCAGTVENVVGRAQNVRVQGGQLLGDIEFMSGEINPLAETVFQMYKAGFLSAVSVGFAPIEFKFSSDKARQGGIDFSKVELLECSLVPIPALPSALIQARAAGIDARPVAEWAGRQLSTKAPAMPRTALETIRREFSSAPGARALGTIRAPAIAGRWRNFGEFVRAVARVEMPGSLPDSRLIRAPTGAGEVDPTGGGFAVPEEYSSELIGSLYEEAVLAPLCDRRETDKPAKTHLPAIDETSRADGSRFGGTLSYWKGEGDTPPMSLPKFRSIEFTAHKLIALLTATGELIDDVPLLDGHLRRAYAAEAAFQVDRTILIGTGAGVPHGIVGAPGTISVAKTSGQAKGTIIAENISNMWSRLALQCRKRAVWIINEDAEAQFDIVNSGSGSPASAGMYFPAGANGNEHALLKGRPVIISEVAPLLGTPGDIVLADLSQYILIDGGMQSALSMHVSFDNDQGVFRFVLRIDGGPAWTTPVTPFNGGQTRAAFVQLAAR